MYKLLNLLKKENGVTLIVLVISIAIPIVLSAAVIAVLESKGVIGNKNNQNDKISNTENVFVNDINSNELENEVNNTISVNDINSTVVLNLEDYIGNWYENEKESALSSQSNPNNLIIKEVNGNNLKFYLYLTRLTALQDINVTMTNGYGTFEAVPDNVFTENGDFGKIKGSITLDNSSIKITIVESDVMYINSGMEVTFTCKKKESNLDLIKNALKDVNWINNNVKMQESCFENVGINGEQTLNFMVVCKGENPIIMVEAVSEKDLSKETFMVFCKDDQVISKSITNHAIHIDHGSVEVSPDNKSIRYTYMHMGDVEYYYYEMNNDGFTSKDEVGYHMIFTESGNESISYYFKQNETGNVDYCSEDEYNSAINKYKNMKFYSIDTELTNENIDKYIK